MKYNLNKFLKQNYLFAGFLVFAYLIYSINNNNFYESFIIVIIITLGYLLINFKIFYILLVLIIISNLFFNFNKLIEGYRSTCPYVDKSIDKYIKNIRKKNSSSITTTPNDKYYLRVDKKKLGKYAKTKLYKDMSFDKDSPKAEISQDCINKLGDGTVNLKSSKSYQPICPEPSPSTFKESSISNVAVCHPDST